MKFLACICLILALNSAKAEEAPLSAEARRQLFAALHTPGEAESAFVKLASNIPKQTGRFHFFVPTVYFQSAKPIFVRQASGSETAVMQVTARQFVCGCGCYDGGVESSIAPTDPDFNNVLILNQSGKTTLHLSGLGQWLYVIDATGSGRKEELARWSNATDLGDSPFLIIHDLTKPDLPGMLNIAFNPHMTEPTVVVWPTDENGNPKDSYERANPRATRFSRWQFEPRKDSKYNDFVIQEKKDSKYKEVARFVFDPVKRQWNGPEGGPDDVWKLISNDQYRARFSKPGAKDFVAYKRYDPNSKGEQPDSETEAPNVKDE